jgi:phosphatidylinositol-4,5-bisphosphate 3-kinase
LGHFKSKYGIKRETAPFVFTKEFRKVLGGKSSQEYSEFKSLCKESYQVLRKNADILITLLRMMLCTGIPELTEKSIGRVNI